jgi:Family of unknown function (DUF6801)
VGSAGPESAWRKFRDPRGPALPVALVLVAGVLAGTVGIAAGASGAGTIDISADLTYNCHFPSGIDAVSVAVAATFPASVAPGQRVQPTGVQITAGLGRTAVADLTRLGAASVTASGTFTTIETAQGKSVTAQWPADSPTAYRLPATGGLKLTEAATAPPAAAGRPGTITFTAGDLVLNLNPKKTDGTATTLATVRVPCALGTGASGTLAVITVAAANPSASPSGSQSSPVSPPHKAKIPKGLPPGCGKIKVVGTGTATCAYITGYSDVAKLYGAALLQPKRPARPGLVNVDFAESHQFKKGKLVVHSTGELYYQGRHELPPVTATFLAFRFVPVTATLHLVELTPIRIVSVSGIKAPPYPITVRTTTKISVRVSGVKVNGVPLDVGPHCRAASAVRLDLTGRGQNTFPPKGYTVPTGGPLSGRLTIPRFTACGVSENLNPLLTGSISGPGNFTKVTQGKLCAPSQPANWSCPPPVPKPLR